MWKEFKEFISRGSVIDLAVAVVIGAAFSGVINSFVNDILMPPLGLLLGRVDFSNLFIPLDGQSYASLAEAQAAGAPTLNYGLFITNLISFLIIALAIFLILRAMKAASPRKETVEPDNKECPYCKLSIPVAATRCPECTSQLG
ncbi:MAG TPA: large conductance mechanosensitive channel protein MscL [Anaerolineaceae bacterium]|nr:large conductance mechanosensitive channel protein MscL [Anaerolineaceae bacterium]